MDILLGYEKGDKCNREGCAGIISEHEKDGGCSCHINPPCSYCTEPNAYCKLCGWDAKEEQMEYDIAYMEANKKNEEYYKREREEWKAKEKMFDDMYRGVIPAEKLEIRSYTHTHFSMKKKGVFPKGTESSSTLLPKVRGAFGGRFTLLTDTKFEYIAYTD